MTTAARSTARSLCGRPHREDQIDQRWDEVSALIQATDEDDWAAQWSVIGACACCVGPLKLTAAAQENRFTAPDSDFLCSRCTTEVQA